MKQLGKTSLLSLGKTLLPLDGFLGGNLFRYVVGDDLVALGAQFTRATSATYIGQTGTVFTVGSSTPRDGHYTNGVRTLLLEGQRTNVVLQNRNLTQAVWTKTNVTALLNQQGTDGGANSASSLTSSAANGTCLQAITLASSARFQSAFVKRITGVGAIQMTTDGGTTWTTITVTGSWARVSIPTQTLANPSVGFRIVTSGDAIAVDYVQNEDGTFMTSVIATTAAAVTRSADTLVFPYTASPQVMTAYINAAYIGPDTGGSGRFIQIGKADNTLPFFVLWSPIPRLTVSDSNSTQLSSGNAVDAPTIGHTIELNGVWQGDGQSRCDSCADLGTINNGAPSANAFAGFPSAFSDTKLTVGARDVASVDQMFLAVTKIVIASGDMSLGTMRVA
jgi:hypothetical protein